MLRVDLFFVRQLYERFSDSGVSFLEILVECDCRSFLLRSEALQVMLSAAVSAAAE